jgi:hypothetical protein
MNLPRLMARFRDGPIIELWRATRTNKGLQDTAIYEITENMEIKAGAWDVWFERTMDAPIGAHPTTWMLNEFRGRQGGQKQLALTDEEKRLTDEDGPGPAPFMGTFGAQAEPREDEAVDVVDPAGGIQSVAPHNVTKRISIESTPPDRPNIYHERNFP